MYRSQEYMEIGGKLITCPYGENDLMHGVNLHHLLCELHASGATSLSDIESIIIGAIECECPFTNEEHVSDIFNHVISDLRSLGAITDRTAH